MLAPESEAPTPLTRFINAVRAHLGSRWRDKSRENAVRVRTLCLDHLMRRVGQPADLLLMDVQGLEADVLKGGDHSLRSGKIKTVIIGTHGREIHLECLDILKARGFTIELDLPDPTEQPDGILVASLESISVLE